MKQDLYVLPTLHPARILRNGYALEPAQIKYVTRAVQIVKEIEEGHTPTTHNVYEKPPFVNLFPDDEEIMHFIAGCDERGVACDIENAGDYIICMSVVRLRDLAGIVVHFYLQGGRFAWNSYGELKRRVDLVDDLLGDPKIPKIFHNGQAHDIVYLERAGFIVRNYGFDTILGAHLAYVEMPKALQFNSTMYCDLPCWKVIKEIEGEEATGEGK